MVIHPFPISSESSASSVASYAFKPFGHHAQQSISPVRLRSTTAGPPRQSHNIAWGIWQYRRRPVRHPVWGLSKGPPRSLYRNCPAYRSSFPRGRLASSAAGGFGAGSWICQITQGILTFTSESISLVKPGGSQHLCRSQSSYPCRSQSSHPHLRRLLQIKTRLLSGL